MAGTHFTGGLAMAPVAVTDAATYTVLAKNTGKLHLIPDLTASCTLTLPASAVGLTYKFMYGGAAADAHNWVINTAATTSLFKGGVLFADADAGPAAAEVSAVYADFSNDDTLTVTAPRGGTVIEMVCNGDDWYVTGTVVSVTAPAFS